MNELENLSKRLPDQAKNLQCIQAVLIEPSGAYRTTPGTSRLSTGAGRGDADGVLGTTWLSPDALAFVSAGQAPASTPNGDDKVCLGYVDLRALHPATAWVELLCVAAKRGQPIAILPVALDDPMAYAEVGDDITPSPHLAALVWHGPAVNDCDLQAALQALDQGRVQGAFTPAGLGSFLSLWLDLG